MSARRIINSLASLSLEHPLTMALSPPAHVYWAPNASELAIPPQNKLLYSNCRIRRCCSKSIPVDCKITVSTLLSVNDTNLLNKSITSTFFQTCYKSITSTFFFPGNSKKLKINLCFIVEK